MWPMDNSVALPLILFQPYVICQKQVKSCLRNAAKLGKHKLGLYIKQPRRQAFRPV